jgi:drug/metabolite transporter (DMT)-like permease
MGWIFLALVIVGYVAMNFIMKLGSLKGHAAPALTGALFGVASLFCLIFLIVKGQPLLASKELVLLAVAGGLGGAVAYFCFLSALRIGNYALTISIYTMTFMIPVVFSVIFWKRPLGGVLAAGLACIIVGIAMITTAGSGQEEKKTGLWLKWILYLGAAFFLTGIPQLSQAAAVRLGAINLWFYLFLTFLCGALAFGIYFLIRKIRLGKGLYTFGALAAAGSVAGNFFTLRSLSKLPETIVFPVSLAAPIIAAVLLSLLFFKEKIKRLGYLGIMVGLAGIILLALAQAR